MRNAQVMNGTVINVIIANAGFDPKDGSIIVPSNTAKVGDTYDGTSFTVVNPVFIPPTTNLTYQMFTQLFTAAELTAIMTTIPTKPIILTWMLKLASLTGGIALTDDHVLTALNYLVAQLLITAPRRTAVLAGTIVNPSA